MNAAGTSHHGLTTNRRRLRFVESCSRPSGTSGSDGCVVSVVVPTFKRPDLLKRCLEALAAQSLPPSAYEIVVVDDGSDIVTRDMVASIPHGHSQPEVRYLPSGKRHGPAAARNLGWKAARAEIIAFTDDDCVPDAGWLAAGMRAFEDPDVQGVSGRIVVPLRQWPPTDYELTVAGLQHAPFATANCLYRRTALAAVGGFDERFTRAWREDSDVEFSMRERQFLLCGEPEAVVVHPVRPAVWGVSVRLQRNSMFNALLYKKHPAWYRLRIQPSVPWRYYGIVGAGVAAGLSVMNNRLVIAGVVAAGWLILTADFCRLRLAPTSRRPGHVLEMVFTSVLIPPLAVFWRLYGALRYRVPFL